MAVEYDTDAIRASARKLARASDTMRSASRSAQRIVSAVPSALEGEAGEALKAVLESLESNCQSSSATLQTCSAKLKALETRLKLWDQLGSALISGH